MRSYVFSHFGLPKCLNDLDVVTHLVRFPGIIWTKGRVVGRTLHMMQLPLVRKVSRWSHCREVDPDAGVGSREQI